MLFNPGLSDESRSVVLNERFNPLSTKHKASSLQQYFCYGIFNHLRDDNITSLIILNSNKISDEHFIKLIDNKYSNERNNDST